MTAPPLCACHGEPQRWSKDKDHPNGRWRCVVKLRENDRRYRLTNPTTIRRDRLIAKGLCGHCGQDVLVTGIYCFTCAGKNDARNALRTWR